MGLLRDPPSCCGLQVCAASQDWEAAREVLQELSSPSAPPNIQLTAANMAELIVSEQGKHERDIARWVLWQVVCFAAH